MSKGLACDFGIVLKAPNFKVDEATVWALVIDISGRRTATYDTPDGILFQSRHNKISVAQKQQLNTYFLPDADADGAIQRGVVHLSNVQLPCSIDQLSRIIFSVPVQTDSRKWVFEVLRALKRDLLLSDLLRDPLGHAGDLFRSFDLVEGRINERLAYYINKRGFRVAQFFL